jgi:SAM-dependent MidA family methyltransferase
VSDERRVAVVQEVLRFVAHDEDRRVVATAIVDALDRDAQRPKVGPPTWTCVANSCPGSHPWSSFIEASHEMTEHARTVAHDRQWPVCFRIDYGYGGTPGVTYRDPVLLLDGERA